MNLIKIKEPMSSKNDAKICLGIDFGTTNSVCSVKVNNKLHFIDVETKKFKIEKR